MASTVAPGLDNKFDSNIFALAFPAPKSNPLNGFADAFTGFGKAIEEGQAAELERQKTKKGIELAGESILSSQQMREHNEKFNPLVIQDKQQSIATNKQTFDHNTAMNPLNVQAKTLEVSANEILNKARNIELGDKTVASQDAMQERELYGRLKPLKPTARTTWMPTQNDFYEWNGEKKSFSPAIVNRVISKIEDEELGKEDKRSEIGYRKVQGTAAIMNAKANQTSAGASAYDAKTRRTLGEGNLGLEREKFDYTKEKDTVTQTIDLIKAIKPQAKFEKPTADDQKRVSSAILGIRQIDKILSNKEFSSKVGGPIDATLGRYLSGTMFSGKSGDAYSDMAELAKSVNGSNRSGSGSTAELVSTYKDLAAGGFMGGDNIKNNLMKTRQMLIGRLTGEFQNVLAHDEGKRTEFMALTGIDPFAETQTAAQTTAAQPPKQQVTITPTSKQPAGVPQAKPNQAAQPAWKQFDY